MPTKKDDEKINMDAFIFHRSFYESLKMMINPKTKVAFIERICEYALNNKNSSLDKSKDFNKDSNSENRFMLEAMFINIKPVLKKQRTNYLAKIENGKKGGRPTKTKINK